jgi:hypothetical protein
MYVVLTKNDDNTWDAIRDVILKDELATAIEDALANELPIIGINATAYKSSAAKNAVWNGTSFSGGNINPDMPSDDNEIWDTFNRYVFLSDNKVILSFTVGKDDANSAMYEAAFAGETILVKSTSEPRMKVGKTFNWDGTNLVLVS